MPARTARLRLKPVEIAGDAFTHAAQGGGRLRAGPQRGKAGDRPLDVAGERRTRARGTGIVLHNAHGLPPRVKGIEHVGLTELDADRPPPRPLPGLTFEVSIDPCASDFERDALLRPAHDLLKGRPRHAYQVSVVLATKVGFDLA